MPSGETALARSRPTPTPVPLAECASAERRTRPRADRPGPDNGDTAAAAGPALDMLSAALASCDPPRHPRRSGARAGGPPPGWSVEIVLLGGEEGRRLDALQAAAIKEVLGWLHTQRQRQATNPTPDDG
jgi:hypothetical protein